MGKPLLRMTPAGLYCEAGGFYIDPRRPVAKAIITHAHADHAKKGSREYLTAQEGEHVLRTRLFQRANIQTLPYGHTLDCQGVKVSLHPAGHILGSSQVRVEHRGEVWVFSGDYKVAPDSTCSAFEPVRCHTFITESTFAAPQYRWPQQTEVWAAIRDWWHHNREQGLASVIYCYALGKSQRLLAGMAEEEGPFFTHAAVEIATQDYRETGIALPKTLPLTEAPEGTNWSAGLIIAPPSAKEGRWLRRLGPHATAFASGWMVTAGAPQRHRVQQGFVLSDHCDWNELLAAIPETGAERVLVNHGYVGNLVRELRVRGVNADALIPSEMQEKPAPQPPLFPQRSLFPENEVAE